MNALSPINCSIPAQTAAKAATVRRVEAASRASEDRQDAPKGHCATARQPASARAPQPVAALAAHILGARAGSANANGYGAYEQANRLLVPQSRVVDVTLG